MEDNYGCFQTNPVHDNLTNSYKNKYKGEENELIKYIYF
uniref:Uncharacterized protein n=1 Tax=Anguilla anguilla TaxID=7936 RepID=A0A0E9TWL1_ANGAN